MNMIEQSGSCPFTVQNERESPPCIIVKGRDRRALESLIRSARAEDAEKRCLMTALHLQIAYLRLLHGLTGVQVQALASLIWGALS